MNKKRRKKFENQQDEGKEEEKKEQQEGSREKKKTPKRGGGRGGLEGSGTASGKMSTWNFVSKNYRLIEVLREMDDVFVQLLEYIIVASKLRIHSGH